MKNLDQLIDTLKQAKEELSKGTPNEGGGIGPNGGAAIKADITGGFEKAADVKDVGNGKMVIGKNSSPAQVDKEMHNMTDKNDNEQPPIVDVKHKQSPMDAKLPKAERVIEKCSIAKNGQWSLDKASVDPKLAPKDVKVKELQGKIDAGKYKPDAGKIADKMISHPEKPLKKSEDSELEKANSSVYNAGTHPMKGRQAASTVKGSEFEPDHDLDHDANVKLAHAHYKSMGMNLGDDKIHNIVKAKLKKK